ncbi:hypothetical protein [Tomitella fengzijianii]|uniref:Secreted protein n=1 Tax=Tomitella fengzijianii TaxID=2597660 RepID=A0A516X5P4_9ACTN|nr:hypothetical protein [Tomitella fengzijianii]QDQ98385.1 hypothetical protein FO059_14985 [Tomitella fengzijianii]
MSVRDGARLRSRRGAAAAVVEDALMTRAGHWRDQAFSTPGRLAAIGLVLVLLVLAAGAATGLAVGARDTRIDTLRGSADPLSNAAQDLYSSLSIADASASTAFLAGGLQPRVMVDRYDSAVAAASASLATATMGVGDDDSAARALLASLSTGLPVYTGLIATAGANNRAGNPVGVNYLGEASHLMQTQLLPDAQRLYSEQSATVVDLEHRNASVDWVPLLVIVLALVLLVTFQFYLARRSNRRLNFGLVLATVAVALMFAWTLVAGLVSASFSQRAASESTGPLAAITTARISAQQARTDETRNLLARGDDAEIPQTFHERMDTVGRALEKDGGSTESDALHNLDAWRSAHESMRSHLARGDYAGAVEVAIGTDDASSGSQFVTLDAKLEDRIGELRAHGQHLVDDSDRATAFLVVGSGILAGVAALAIILGLRPRLSEYQ